VPPTRPKHHRRGPPRSAWHPLNRQLLRRTDRLGGDPVGTYPQIALGALRRVTTPAAMGYMRSEPLFLVTDFDDVDDAHCVCETCTTPWGTDTPMVSAPASEISRKRLAVVHELHERRRH
jgi:hypothetical protein